MLFYSKDKYPSATATNIVDRFNHPGPLHVIMTKHAGNASAKQVPACPRPMKYLFRQNVTQQKGTSPEVLENSRQTGPSVSGSINTDHEPKYLLTKDRSLQQGFEASESGHTSFKGKTPKVLNLSNKMTKNPYSMTTTPQNISPSAINNSSQVFLAEEDIFLSPSGEILSKRTNKPGDKLRRSSVRFADQGGKAGQSNSKSPDREKDKKPVNAIKPQGGLLKSALKNQPLTESVVHVHNPSEEANKPQKPGFEELENKTPEDNHYLSVDMPEEAQINHLKNVVDKLYPAPTEKDEEKEYPSLNNASIYRDILLEAEQKKREQELFVMKKRQLNAMKKLAGDLERDIDNEGILLDEMQEEVDRVATQTDIQAKKRALELALEDIEEAEKEDNEMKKKMEQAEAEFGISELIRQNEQVMKGANDELKKDFKDYPGNIRSSRADAAKTPAAPPSRPVPKRVDSGLKRKRPSSNSAQTQPKTPVSEKTKSRLVSKPQKQTSKLKPKAQKQPDPKKSFFMDSVISQTQNPLTEGSIKPQEKSRNYFDSSLSNTNK